MMRIIIAAALAMALSACGNSGLLSSNSDNNESLFDFNMVPSDYRGKVASSDNVDDVASLAQAIQTLDQRVSQANAMMELNDLTQLRGDNNANYSSPFSSLKNNLASELQRCSLDTITDRVDNTTIMSYGYMPDVKDCNFNLRGSYRDSKSTVGPNTPGAPTLATVTDTFTLTPLASYKGKIASISYSLKSSEFSLKKSQRGEMARDEKQITVTGTIVYNDGSEVVFGMKRALGETKTRVSDRRSNTNTTKDFRAGFRISDTTVLYQDYYQKLANDDKATKYQAINGLKLSNEN